MDPRSRAAVVTRWQSVAGNIPCPQRWDDIDSVTLQLRIADADPVLAEILQGRCSAETELMLLRGTLPERFEGLSQSAQTEADRAAFLADAERRMADHIAQLQNASKAAQDSQAIELARQESAALAAAALTAAGRQARGW